MAAMGKSNAVHSSLIVVLLPGCWAPGVLAAVCRSDSSLSLHALGQ